MRIEQTQDRATCIAIRHVVFVEEQDVPPELEVHGEGADCLHFLGFEGETPIATLRITPLGATAKVERVAVLKTHRGKGAGAELIQTVLDDLRGRGFTHAKLGSQTVATGFYERLGFEAFGATFVDAGIEHIMMQRAL